MPRSAAKYGNVPTVIDGIRFASKAEAGRYGELRLLCLAGAISNLSTQPRYLLTVNGVKLGTYVGDFRYFENGQEVCEDVKGFRTPVYKLKAKLVRALFGIAIREVQA